MWYAFKDQLPPAGYAILAVRFDRGDFDPKDETMWVHLEMLHVESEAFGVALYNDNGRLSEYAHDAYRQDGMWIMIEDLIVHGAPGCPLAMHVRFEGAGNTYNRETRKRDDALECLAFRAQENDHV